MSSSNYTQTPNLGLIKPNYNMDTDQWGTHLNQNADTLDVHVGDSASKVYVDTAVADYLLLAGGTVTGPLIYNATGGNTPRSAQDRAADTINVKDFSAVADGVTNDTPAIQAAVNYAATFTPPKPVYAPAGIYVIGSVLTMGTFVSGQMLRGDEGGTVFLLGPANTANVGMITIAAGMKRVVIEGITFDGNAANNLTGVSMMLQLATDTDIVTVRRCHFRNTNKDAISAPGDQPITAVLNAQANPGQAVINFAALPAGLKPGAYVSGSATLDADMYLIATTSTTATFNRNLTDTVLSGAGITFTHAFATSANALYGDTTILTTDTTGLAVGQQLYIAGNGCFQSYTRITAIVANTSVTIDRFLLNKLPSGSNVAAAAGHSRLTVEGNHFSNIGQSRMIANSRNYNTSGVQAPGSFQVVLKNFGATWAGKIGVYPGQKTAASGLPAGVPANTLVRDMTYSSAANTHTITLASALTASVADNTPIPFQVAQGGGGYVLWQSWGGWHAHADLKFLHNRIEHAWASPVYINTTWRAILMGNTYIQDQMEFRDPNVAPSACIGLGNCVNPHVIGEVGIGATGSGIEAQHVVGAVISGCTFANNGVKGIALYGGHSNIINGVNVDNNGQYVNVPMVQDYVTVAGSQQAAGLLLSGTQTFASPGTMNTISVSAVSASDTQNAPTQYYGVASGPGTYAGYQQGAVVGTGNVGALLDTNITTAASVISNAWGVGSTWTRGPGVPTSSQPVGSIYSRSDGVKTPALYAMNASGVWVPLDTTSAVGDEFALYSTGTSVGNGADLTEDILYNYSLPAGALGAVGEIIHLVAGGTFSATTDNKSLRIRFGGTALSGIPLISMSAFTVTATQWSAEAWITKTGTNTQSYCSIGSTVTTTAGGTAGTMTQNDTNPIQILVTGQNVANPVAGAVTCQYLHVELLR